MSTTWVGVGLGGRVTCHEHDSGNGALSGTSSSTAPGGAPAILTTGEWLSDSCA